MLRKSLLDEVGVFDESMPVCEDYDLWLRIAIRYPFKFLSDKLIVKRGGHEGSVVTKILGDGSMAGLCSGKTFAR